MVKRLVSDAWGELVETGKAAAKQSQQLSPTKIADSATEQITGAPPGSDVPPGLEDLKGKKPTSSQLKQMQQQDDIKRKKGMSDARLGLKRLIVQRYQKMQQEIVRKREEKEQAIRAKEKEEVEELKAKEQEEEVKQKKLVKPPTGSKKAPGLGIFARQKRGTRETRLGKMG